MGAKSEFDAYADDYESALGQGLAVSGEGREYFAHGRLAFLRDCLRDLGPAPAPKTARVMDFGCGTGTSVPIIKDLLGAETIAGVDESARLIEHAAAKHAAPGIAFSISEGFVPEANFDLVYTSGVFHHVPVPRRPATFAFLRDVLRPGGVLAVWENNPWSLPARYVMSRIPFDRDAVMLSARRVRELARAQGFQVLRTDYLFIFPASLRVLRPLEAMARRAPLGAQYQVLCAKSAGGVGPSQGPTGDRWRLILLSACLLVSLALYAGFAVLLGSVPPGWNGIVGFSLPSGPLFRSFTGLPALALSPDEFRRAFMMLLSLLWGLWGVAVFAFRGVSGPEARRRATIIVTAGGVAILLLVVVLVPPMLSSDLYRQAVYGRMVVYHGLNPYASPVNAVPGDPLFALANHQHLTTHYGPAYTLLSALVAAIAPSTILGGAIAWKATAAAAALGCALLVGRVVRALGGAEADAQNARLWLAWNPLLVLEAAASGHVEPIMMLPALGGILLWQQRRPVRGVVALVTSTLTKWVTGLLVLFALVWEVKRAAPGRRLRTLLPLAGAAALTTALYYAPFAGGLMTRRGGISDIAMRGAATVGSGSATAIPQWVLLACFAAAVIGLTVFVARGDWPRLIATTAALLLAFVVVVNPWPFPWYYLSPVVLAATLPRGRAGFILRLLSLSIGGTTMLLYARLVASP